MAVLWKKTNQAAVNMILTLGSFLSLLVGVCFLWVFPKDQHDFWPHYLMLSFYLFMALVIMGIIISLTMKPSEAELAYAQQAKIPLEKPSKKVMWAWILLFITMLLLYIYFS